MKRRINTIDFCLDKLSPRLCLQNIYLPPDLHSFTNKANSYFLYVILLQKKKLLTIAFFSFEYGT
jgi:hypothetical protein